ncbi:hypothetical protein JMA_39570 (plasmid) [Jeotgalibacillus malaysiensis]|uniref:Uncharacterized protein n=1 Tax=Jeotgalibacillus malaysiensis TaxID=1508404 RepID=A0A0B5ASU7_9BACL|nr:hypothetical protein [Jeotgalibacillus malaysiensis]AJD93275.1 hypothetical protein JMA_39570 [Jeotgalibacillus malaysiensis]
MTIEQVIKAGESVPSTMGDIPVYVWILLGISILWVVLSLLTGNEFYLVLFFVCFAFGLHGALSIQSTISNERFAKWEEEYVIPYLDSLPLEKREVVFLKIETDLELPRDVYRYSEESLAIKKTPLTVSFKGNGVETYTDWVETHMELTDEEKPYIEFKRLKKDLGNGIDAGLYNEKVYLPESYTFTDIK